MKIFQIMNGRCWWDATPVAKTQEDARQMFAEECFFVAAPDFVFEGWGYDPTAEGDDRFVKPQAPAGYVYDDVTGTFYPVNRQSEAEQLADRIAQMRELLAEAEAKLAEITAGGGNNE